MRAVILGVNGMTGRAIAREFVESGWDVTGTGRDAARFRAELGEAGVRLMRSDRTDASDLAQVLDAGADAVVDCVAYTAEQARLLAAHAGNVGTIVALSSKAVYVDAQGRHSNSDEPPAFDGPVAETNLVMAPDFSGAYASREGYGANKVAMELALQDAACPVSILRPSRIDGLFDDALDDAALAFADGRRGTLRN